MDQTNPGSDATKEVRFTLDELNLIFYGGSMGGAWGHWTVVGRAADGQPELGPAADADQMTLMRQTLLAFGAETMRTMPSDPDEPQEVLPIGLTPTISENRKSGDTSQTIGIVYTSRCFMENLRQSKSFTLLICS